MEAAAEERARRSLAAIPDLAGRIRQLRSFLDCYAATAARLSRQYEVEFVTDERRLTRAFLDWMEAFSRRAARGVGDRRDFSVYAAGLALVELIRSRPTSAKKASRPPKDLPIEPTDAELVRFWPEGFLYTTFCLDVLAVVLAQEFGEDLHTVPAAHQLKGWWTYRENVEQDPKLAIPFLDYFVGNVPNWAYPDLPAARPAGDPLLAVTERARLSDRRH
ncbi:MAG: hypothetical protein U1E45_22320 [Geminicoccaceae bacterium]